MGILLYFVAKILQWCLSPLFHAYSIISLLRIKKYHFGKDDKYFIYILSFKLISEHFHMVAFALDQLGNVMGAPIMNSWLLKKNPIKLYGDPDSTISHVTGVNYIGGKLTWLGMFLAKVLNKVDKNHVEKAAESEQ